jgi:hypothetical protein
MSVFISLLINNIYTIKDFSSTFPADEMKDKKLSHLTASTFSGPVNNDCLSALNLLEIKEK